MSRYHIISKIFSNINRSICFIALLLLLPSIAIAQSYGSLKVIVTDEAGNGIAGASIIFDRGNGRYDSYADTEGVCYFKLIPSGQALMTISTIGYTKHIQKIVVKPGKCSEYKIVLREYVAKLNEISVVGKTSTQRAQEQSYQVSVIDAKKLYNSTLNIAHALNNVPGIRARESGGLGSNMEFSLNGFSGNQVKFFIDGIPMENMGNAFRLNNIPINLASRIEVYKGVVPVELGADALGGAINIVTNTGRTNYLDASFSFGSFNTYKTSVNMAMNTKSGFTILLNVFQNYSKNNYWVDTETPINEYGQIERVRARRFHDQYRNEMVMLGIGVRNKKWADQLILGLDLGQYAKDLQTGVTMEDVYGEREAKGVTILPSLKFLKKNVLVKGLDFNLSGNFNLGYDRTIDTANRQYNWKGEVIRENNSKGAERNRMDSRYRDNDGVFTANLSYRISEKHSFVLNNSYTTFKRVTTDLLKEVDQFSNRPSSIGKNTLGLSYRYDHSERWNTSVFGKYFTQKSKAFVNINQISNPRHEDFSWVKNTFQTIGYGLASTYFLKKNLQIRASYEHGIRVPTSSELFGNMNTLTGNVSLKPESSDNLNLGAIYSPTINNVHFLTFDVAFLYRYSKDFIRPKLERNMSNTVGQQMVNLRDVDNKGLEGSVRYRYKNRFNIGANISYQNLINQTKYEGGSDDIVSIVYKDRLPNMPYLFGNADAAYTISRPFGSDGSLTIGYQLMYVHQYFETWPSMGTQSTKDNIPTQWNHNANVIYTFKGGRYNLTLECLNLTDALLYDHFKLQKPSRAFNIKFRYFVFNTK